MSSLFIRLEIAFWGEIRRHSSPFRGHLGGFKWLRCAAWVFVAQALWVVLSEFAIIHLITLHSTKYVVVGEWYVVIDHHRVTLYRAVINVLTPAFNSSNLLLPIHVLLRSIPIVRNLSLIFACDNVGLSRITCKAS